jgi:hypothetical protein
VFVLLSAHVPADGCHFINLPAYLQIVLNFFEIINEPEVFVQSDSVVEPVVKVALTSQIPDRLSPGVQLVEIVQLGTDIKLLEHLVSVCVLEHPQNVEQLSC